MVIDAFTFFNELDILEIRLRTLDPVVDQFVLVEMTRTFAGNPKPLYYAKSAPRFARWHNKIVHIGVRDTWIEATYPNGQKHTWDRNECEKVTIPAGTNPASHWQREYHQRNAIMYGLHEAQPNDTILISDVDEIPRPIRIPHSPFTDDLVLMYDQAFYYYSFNHRVPQTWYGTRTMRFQTLQNLPIGNIAGAGGDLGGPVQTARYLGKFIPYESLGIVFNAGWHFSHFGGAEIIRNKLLNGAHQEVNRPEWTDLEAIKQRIAEHRDLFDRAGLDPEFIADNRDLPACVLEDSERYKAHFAQGVLV